TKSIYWLEDLFDLLPIHWMWWPALAGVIVGLVGWIFPRTLGVGYFNISDLISGKLVISTIVALAVWKFASWSISLSSGTSGGTLAPLFTIGGALGAILGNIANSSVPAAGIDLRIAALVGMAAMFAGASRALLASVVFAFETTLQPLGLLPLLGGCTTAFLMSSLLMRNTIMTEKIARRGVRVPAEYEADFFESVLVRDVAATQPVSLRMDQSLLEVRAWLTSNAEGSSHQGFPVLDERGRLHSVVTRRDLLERSLPGDLRLADVARRPPVVVYDDSTLRDAADHMVRHNIGRLPVIQRSTGNLVAIVTRSDLLGAHRTRLQSTHEHRRHLSWRSLLPSFRVTR
ncbi:MAG TPA: chloride channel protein, partial [Phycisphaerales bacterium]|nr:chloride channel protein [Phycisphaerales bacterium]